MTYKPKYTPGPWVITPNISHERRVLPADRTLNGGFHICDLYGSDKHTNAQLIATAPELVEALTKAYYRLCSIQYYERYSVKGQQELAFIRDTLAKATGIDDELVQNGELYKGD